MMLLTNLWGNPSVVGLVAGVPALVVVLVGWLLSRDKDAAVKKAGEDLGNTEWAKLIQGDNADLRGRIEKLEVENGALKDRISELEKINGGKK